MNSLIVKAKRTYARSVYLLKRYSSRLSYLIKGYFVDIRAGLMTKKEKKVVLLFIFIVLLLSIALPVGAAHWVLKLN